MANKIALLLLLACLGCRSYTAFSFHGDGSMIYETHKKIPQPYCQKVWVCLDRERQRYGYLYCIISPCCTGTYFDTTGLAQQEIVYEKSNKK